MSVFLNIKEVIIPKTNIEALYDHLRKVGSHGMEGIGLFLGKFQEEKFIVTTTIIPNQEGYKTDQGLMYYVGGEELHQINVWAYKNKLSLIAQIHSHPGEAYHSEMDDAYPIVTTVGSFSIVIPDFGSGTMDIETWAVYRLLPGQGWTYMRTDDLQKIFKVV